MNLSEYNEKLLEYEDFARDLARAVVAEKLQHPFVTNRSNAWEYERSGLTTVSTDNAHRNFFEKWFERSPNGSLRPKYPSLTILASLGYLMAMEAETDDSYKHKHYMYWLTDKSWNLLKTIGEAPYVFISYKRAESRILALLVEARLINRGLPSGRIFIDKNIQGGDQWEERIRHEIESCTHLICLIGPETKDSEWVRKEVQLAQELGKSIIPICHNGATLESEANDLIGHNSLQGYAIKRNAEDESCLDYEALLTFLIKSISRDL